jgi:hypothetical protein
MLLRKDKVMKNFSGFRMQLQRFLQSSRQQHDILVSLFNNNNNYYYYYYYYYYNNMNTAKCIFIFCRYIRGHGAITGHRNNYSVLRFLSLVTAMYAGECISFRCFIFSKVLHHIGQIHH